jgi:hypothetical protein
MTAPRYRVVVDTGRKRVEGCVTIHEEEVVECTAEQAAAYMAGDPDWRNAGQSAFARLANSALGWLRRR